MKYRSPHVGVDPGPAVERGILGMRVVHTQLPDPDPSLRFDRTRYEGGIAGPPEWDGSGWDPVSRTPPPHPSIGARPRVGRGRSTVTSGMGPRRTYRRSCLVRRRYWTTWETPRRLWYGGISIPIPGSASSRGCGTRDTWHVFKGQRLVAVHVGMGGDAVLLPLRAVLDIDRPVPTNKSMALGPDSRGNRVRGS